MVTIVYFHSISKKTSRIAILSVLYGKDFYSIQTKKAYMRVSIMTCEYSQN